MKPSIRQARKAASRLLSRWLEAEGPLHAALHRPLRSEQREALGRAAIYFGVVRGLRRSSDEQQGLPRFELLRRCVARVDRARVSEQNVAVVTTALADAVAGAYGGKRYLSLASKLLWAKYRDPYVIYDSEVRRYLETPPGDYSAYLQAWRECYSLHATAIGTACETLASSPTVASKARGILRTRWFRHRTLDLLIWHGGA